jgi:hypothetical protein
LIWSKYAGAAVCNTVIQVTPAGFILGPLLSMASTPTSVPSITVFRDRSSYTTLSPIETAERVMAKIISKPISSEQVLSTELTEQQLDIVVGGSKSKAGANLFKSCATGEHIKSAKLVC